MKIKHLLIFIFILVQSAIAFAGIVTKDDARNVAYNFVKERIIGGQTSWNLDALSIKDEETVVVNEQPVYYVFSNNGEGYIIISAEDNFTPVIGYAFEGSLTAPGINKNFDSFLRSFTEQINWARSHPELSAGEFDTQWESYRSGNITDGSNATSDVAPLLLVMWNQDSPYNMYCPVDPDGPGGHVYAGCVATAMSMIMYHYRYPIHGNGSHSYYAPGYGTQYANFGDTYYDWDQMQNSIGSSSGDCIPAVALLQYHAGVAVNMGYAADGSGAYSTDVPNAMKNYFSYSPSIQYLVRSSYTAANWESMVLEQLNAAKPIYYAGQSPDGGHAFVCDGYQVSGATKMFHFNFGWSGQDNGYYTLANPNGFTSSQNMVRNFIPPSTNYPYGCSSETFTQQIGSFEDGSGPLLNYENNLSCSWVINPVAPVASFNLTVNNIDLNTSDSLYFYDGIDENAPLLAVMTGTGSKAVVTTTVGQAFVKFVTDGSGNSKGFQIEFNPNYIQYCSSNATLTDPVGSFSDGSEAENYNNGTFCKFKINPANAADLTVTFTDFDLADDDMVKIIALTGGATLGEFKGNEIPAPVTLPHGGMLVIFTSNSFGTSGGFSATYTIGNVDNEKPENVVRMQLTPNPARDITTLKLFATKQAANALLIYDNAGKLIESRTINCNSGLNSIDLDISKLNPGIYNLKLFSDSGTLTSKLVVK